MGFLVTMARNHHLLRYVSLVDEVKRGKREKGERTRGGKEVGIEEREDGKRRRWGVDGKGGYEMIRFEFYVPDANRCPSYALAHFSFIASCIIDNYFQLLFIDEKMGL